MTLICLVKDGKAVCGETRIEVVRQIANVVLDVNHYTMCIDGVMDTITYRKDSYDKDDFVREAYKRAMELLIRRGWKLFVEA